MRRQVVQSQPALQAFHQLSRVFFQFAKPGPAPPALLHWIQEVCQGDVLEDPIFEASSSSTSGTLQRSSHGFPLHHGRGETRCGQTSDKARDTNSPSLNLNLRGAFPLWSYLLQAKRAVHKNFLGEQSKRSTSGWQFEKSTTLATLQNWRRRCVQVSDHPSEAVRWIKAIQEIIQKRFSVKQPEIKIHGEEILGSDNDGLQY